MIDFACVSSTTPTWDNDPRWCTPGIAATEAEHSNKLAANRASSAPGGQFGGVRRKAKKKSSARSYNKTNPKNLTPVMSMLEKWEDMTARKAAVSLEKERKYVLRIKAGEGLRPPGRAPLCPDAELWLADVVSVMILRDEPLHHQEIKKMAKAMFIELGLKDISGRPYTKDTCMDGMPAKGWIASVSKDGVYSCKHCRGNVTGTCDKMARERHFLEFPNCRHSLKRAAKLRRKAALSQAAAAGAAVGVAAAVGNGTPAPVSDDGGSKVDDVMGVGEDPVGEDGMDIDAPAWPPAGVEPAMRA
eukprot:jgi/Tetstr1/437364/TSEL_026049.t1